MLRLLASSRASDRRTDDRRLAPPRGGAAPGSASTYVSVQGSGNVENSARFATYSASTDPGSPSGLPRGRARPWDLAPSETGIERRRSPSGWRSWSVVPSGPGWTTVITDDRTGSAKSRGAESLIGWRRVTLTCGRRSGPPSLHPGHSSDAALQRFVEDIRHVTGNTFAFVRASGRAAA